MSPRGESQSKGWEAVSANTSCFVFITEGRGGQWYLLMVRCESGSEGCCPLLGGTLARAWCICSETGQ